MGSFQQRVRVSMEDVNTGAASTAMEVSSAPTTLLFCATGLECVTNDCKYVVIAVF